MARSGSLAVPLCDRDVWVFGGSCFEPHIKLFIPALADGGLVSLPNCISCELHSSSRNSAQVSVACSKAKVTSVVRGCECRTPGNSLCFCV